MYVSDGSKTGVDVPLLGEKKQGSPITQERGVDKDGPQTFTDIPLNTADLKTSTNDKSAQSSQGSALSKKEADSGQYKTSTSFLSFFLPSVSPTSQNVKPEINPSLDKNERSGQKRLPSPQIFEPQLIPPSSEPVGYSSKIISESNATVKTSDVTNLLTATPLDLVSPTEQPEKLVKSSEPPRIPLPPSVSSQNISGSKNPYALRNNQNSVSSFSILSKSPPSNLGSFDSIPLYSSSNVTNSPPNLFNYLSGPQVTASTISSDILPSENIINPVEIATNSLNSPSITSESKLSNFTQNNIPESKPFDIAPPITNMFLPKTLPFTHNTHSELQQKSDILSANYFPKVTSHATLYPVQTSEQTSLAGTINPPNIAEQVFLQPKIISPSQTTKDSPQTELKAESSNSELKTNLSTLSVAFASLNSSVSGQSVLTGPSNQETFSQKLLETNSKNEKSSNEHSVTFLSSAPQPLSKIFHDSQPEKSVPPYIPPVNEAKPEVSSELGNKYPQEKCIKPEVNPFQPFRTSTSTTDKHLVEKVDGLPPLLSSKTEQNNLLKTEESLYGPIGFQSKQVTMDNTPPNENKNIRTNADTSNDILIKNNVSQKSVGLSNPPSLSGYFKEPLDSSKTPSTESSIHILPNQSMVTPSITSASQSYASTFFGQVSSSLGWNQEISAPIVPDMNTEHILQTNAISGNNESIFQPPTMIPNSGVITSSQQLFNVQNQPDITKNTPDTPLSSIPLHNISINSSNSNNPIPSNVPSLYPQPLYTFPKLNSNSYSYPFQQSATLSTFSSAPPPAEPVPNMDPTSSNPLIPTLNYFSSSQNNCLPPSLDQPVQKSTCKTPPSSYYFEPIQKPDSVPVSYSFQSSIPKKIEPMPPIFNPTPSAPPKTFNIPPPNVCYPTENTPTFNQQATYNEVPPILNRVSLKL